MTGLRDEKRKLHALRKHIDELLAVGAVVAERDPLTLSHAGQTLRVKYGMLISYCELADMVEPTADHGWSGSERQRAVESCLHHLDQALDATGDAIIETAVHARATATR